MPELFEVGRDCFAVVERSTAAFVGWLALQPPDDGSVTEVELGYRLAASV